MRLVQELTGVERDGPVHCIGGSDLCDLFQITPAMLAQLVKRGIAIRLGRNSYDLEQTIRNHVTHLRGIASGRGGEEQNLTLTGERAPCPCPGRCPGAQERDPAQGTGQGRGRGTALVRHSAQHSRPRPRGALAPARRARPHACPDRPRLRLSEWVEANIVLPEGVSAQPGPVQLWPFQREIADAIGDPLIERVALVKPVRVGFTTLLTSALAATQAVARALVRDGEAFVHLVVTESGALCPRLIAAGQVDTDLTRELGGGRRIVSGIELDEADQVLACHVCRDQPGATFASYSPPVRIPASDMLHVFDRLFPGQGRGLSWLAPVLLKLRDLDETSDALLMQQKVASLMTGYIRDPDAERARDQETAG